MSGVVRVSVLPIAGVVAITSSSNTSVGIDQVRWSAETALERRRLFAKGLAKGVGAFIAAASERARHSVGGAAAGREASAERRTAPLLWLQASDALTIAVRCSGGGRAASSI